MTHATAESKYVHGTDPNEQARLSLLNDIFNDRCLNELGLSKGERVLDVGSGLGQLTRAMGKVAGAGLVLGVERSKEQIGDAVRRAAEAGESGLVEFRQGDAMALPLSNGEWGSFDVAHTRFVLEHVPEPGVVVEQMARAVKRGGRVVLADDDHDVIRLNPEPAHWPRLIHTYCRTYDRLGNDPYVGRRLVSLLAGAGLKVRRCTALWFGAAAGEEHYPAAMANMVGIFEGARKPMTAPGMMTSEEFDQAVGALRAWTARPDAVMWYCIPWAEAVKP